MYKHGMQSHVYVKWQCYINTDAFLHFILKWGLGFFSAADTEF